MPSFPVAAVVVMLASSTVLAQTTPASAARFDGDWLVTISCPNNTERSAARGYKLQFPARVSDGRIVGERGNEDGPGWLRIEGKIGDDGKALLDAHGRTGDPESRSSSRRRRRGSRTTSRHNSTAGTGPAGVSSSASATSSSSAAERASGDDLVVQVLRVLRLREE